MTRLQQSSPAPQCKQASPRCRRLGCVRSATGCWLQLTLTDSAYHRLSTSESCRFSFNSTGASMPFMLLSESRQRPTDSLASRILPDPSFINSLEHFWSKSVFGNNGHALILPRFPHQLVTVPLVVMWKQRNECLWWGQLVPLTTSPCMLCSCASGF